MAARCCVNESGRGVKVLYAQVVKLACHARSLYDKDVMAGIGDEYFIPMMFYDACFLVQFMYHYKPPIDTEPTDKALDPFLHTFFNIHEHDILHDLLLLENQIPWPVVKAILKVRAVPLRRYVAASFNFQRHSSRRLVSLSKAFLT